MRAGSGTATAWAWYHRRQSWGVLRIGPVWFADRVTGAVSGWVLWIETAVVHRWEVLWPAEATVEVEWEEAPVAACHGYQLGYCGLTDDGDVVGTAAVHSTTRNQSLHADVVVATVQNHQWLISCSVSSILSRM